MPRDRSFFISRKVLLRVELLEDRTVPSVFTPSQVRHAYGFDQITFSTASGMVVGTGAGQTIAIVDAYDNPRIASDLQHFDQTFGLPDAPSFTEIKQAGTVANAGWSSEISLDVEWAHAIAPGARILLVEARSSNPSDLGAAVTLAARQPGVTAISMSWGGGEFSSESSYDNLFTTPANHPGITFVASTGDNGAPGTWPAVSANVLAVGGTSLHLSSTGAYQSETAWAESGGGVSQYEPKPAYQWDVSTGSSSKRTTPDVSYNADPDTGVYVYDSYNGGWFAEAGTSAGAPQWAALISIADQGRALAGKAALDGASQTLFALYQMAQSSASTYFHDVVSGNNGYPAKSGYDDVTGNGSPIATAIVPGLVAWNGSGSTGLVSGLARTAVPTGAGKAHGLATPVASPEQSALPPSFLLPIAPNPVPVLAQPAIWNSGSGSAVSTFATTPPSGVNTLSFVVPSPGPWIVAPSGIDVPQVPDIPPTDEVPFDWAGATGSVDETSMGVTELANAEGGEVADGAEGTRGDDEGK